MRGSSLAGLGQHSIVVKMAAIHHRVEQQRLIVERIDVTDTALHEQEDDPFGLGGRNAAVVPPTPREPAERRSQAAKATCCLH